MLLPDEHIHWVQQIDWELSLAQALCFVSPDLLKPSPAVIKRDLISCSITEPKLTQQLQSWHSSFSSSRFRKRVINCQWPYFYDRLGLLAMSVNCEHGAYLLRSAVNMGDISFLSRVWSNYGDLYLLSGMRWRWFGYDIWGLILSGNIYRPLMENISLICWEHGELIT